MSNPTSIIVKDGNGTSQTVSTLDAVLAATLSVGGTVAVGNLPATQAVTGSVAVSNFPATQAISASALPLPAGAATASAQPALNADGGALAHVMNFPLTQAVTATSLPLPTGAALDATLGTLGTAPPALPGSSTGIMGLLRWMGTLFASLVATAAGTATRVVLVDPTSGNGSLVQAFHNADNQALGGTSYGLMTGGVDQLLNGAGNLDRKRAVSGDGMTVTGLAAEVPMLWNGATFDRATGSATRGQDVNVKNFPATQPVTGTFFLATQPVSGAVAVSPYTASAPITPGTPVTAGRGVLISCTVAGNQSLKLSGGNTITVPVNVGTSLIDNMAITDAPAAGTTATATVTALS